MQPILVVDDNSDNAELLRIVLTRAGYDVEVAGDPDSALAATARRLPALALLDLHMPGPNDGLDLARALKANPETAAVVLVALTGSVGDEGRDAAREAGFDGFMTKPVDTRGLPATVAGFLDGTLRGIPRA
jgi:CheY-like chemotaxis protein